MTRAGAGALLLLALGAGLALRLVRLDVRPMHHDEANQAVKFGALLERGEYRYDAHDHHGPTLYYLTLPAAALRGQHTLASLDERTLRGVTAGFGAAAILLTAYLAGAIGRTAAAAGALLLALSPAMVFYSRMFIQESLFACFTLAFVIAAGRLVTGGGVAWGAAAGLAAGLAAATKETAVIVLPSALLGCAVAWWSMGFDRPREWFPRGVRRAGVLAAAAVAALVVALFYSSFFSDPSGVLGPFRAAGTYVERGTAPAVHAQPWHYYARLATYSASGGLRWSEGAIVLLALAGTAGAWRRPDRARPERRFWSRYLAVTTVLSAAAFSAIPYKTPWNLLPFYVTAIVLAGIGFAMLFRVTASRVVQAGLIAALAAAAGHLGWQAWRASVTYAADPRNPYVYAQTVPDAVRLAARIRDLATLHPDGSGMLVSVIAPPHEQWPLPWYLRGMPHVGYWGAPADALPVGAPVIVSSLEHTGTLDAALGDRFVSEFYGLRPEVVQALYVERALWERFLARAAAGAPEGGS